MASRTTLASLTLILIILNLHFTLFTKIATATCGCTPPSTPKPTLPTPASPPTAAKCPRDALKLGVCVNVLKGLLNVTLGQPPVEPCCTLIKGLADLEAAACLCTALKANVLGNNLNVPIALTVLLNVCSKQVPPGFQC